MNQQEMQALINSVYPEDCRELLAASHKTWRERVKRNADAWKDYYGRPVVTIKDGGNSEHGGLSLSIKHPGFGGLLTVSIKAVEKCCAMCLLYDFQVLNTIDPKLLKQLMDGFLSNATGWMWFSSRRLIVNMVEHHACKVAFDALQEVIPSENPKIQYQPLYDYFKANARVQTMLMPNANNSNVIHHMEVVFPKDYFN